MSKTETRVSSLNDGAVELTTNRLNFIYNDIGNSGYASMTLDAVASCAVGHRADQNALRAGVALLVIGVLLRIIWGYSGNEISNIAFLVGIILIALFFLLRKTVLQIESTGGKVFIVSFGGDSEAVVTGFIKEINTTKLKYLHNMQTNATTTDSA